MFDAYTVKARLYPIIILFFPIILTGVLYSLELQSLVHLGTSICIVGALTYLLSQLGRDLGKKKESGLWQSWGGMPTVQVLRLRDKRIDPHTKQRYHQKLQILCPVPRLPDADLEVSEPDSTDEIYRTWTKYLISKTRDESKFPLILKELTSYGFRRNLWGLKPFGLLITLGLIAGIYTFEMFQTKFFNPTTFSSAYQYSTIGLFIVLSLWLGVVTKNWVEIAAFSYAERLCEATENL